MDDEPHVIRGLRLAMHQFRDTWTVRTASSGAEALAALEGEAFDALVTDARMPGMDGASLLRRAAERWPSTLRVVLSGETGREGFERLRLLAHHFFSKPVAVPLMQRRIEDSLVVRAMLEAPAVRERVSRLRKQLPYPFTFKALSVLARAHADSVTEFIAAVEADAALRDRVLHAINDAGFLDGPVDSMADAVRRVGVRLLCNVILAVDVFAGPGLDRLRAAALARLWVAPWVLELLRLADLREEVTTACVLVDLGHALTNCDADHSLVGAGVLASWGFPTTLVDAVALHHERHERPPTVPSAVALICALEALVRGEGSREAALEFAAATGCLRSTRCSPSSPAKPTHDRTSHHDAAAGDVLLERPRSHVGARRAPARRQVQRQR